MFPSADELKKKFIVYGSFYDLGTPAGIIPCRNLLEIYERQYHAQAGFTNILPDGGLFNAARPCSVTRLYQGQPDAIFIMMNPGSSEPRQNGYIPPIFAQATARESISTNSLVIAKPDVTQYQAMKLMASKKWRHIRILNLSDIREPKSPIFIEKATSLSAEAGCDIHSIFSPDRRDELSAALVTKKYAPVILAWGRNPKLLPLAEQCLKSLPELKTVGVSDNENPRLYAHPSPTLQSGKDRWLNDILQKL